MKDEMSVDELRARLRSGERKHIELGPVDRASGRLSKDALVMMIGEAPDTAIAMLSISYEDAASGNRRTMCAVDGDIDAIAFSVVDSFFRSEATRRALFRAIALRVEVEIEREERRGHDERVA